MFDQKTVFILGAGASWHYGYPTGEALVGKVIDAAREAARFFRNCAQANPLQEPRPAYVKRKRPEAVSTEQIRQQWNNACEECEEFVRKLEQVNPLVIDYFLGQNPKLQDIGKLCIAWIILECEAKYLEHRGNENRLDHGIRNAAMRMKLRSFNDDWYRFLLHKLLSNCASSEHLLKNNVSFITFNYDISLEYALYNGLNAMEFLDPKHVQEFLGGDRFLHVYGKIRKYPSNDFKPVDYGFFIDRLLDNYDSHGQGHLAFVKFLDEIYEASKNLKVIDPTDKFNDREALSAANRHIKEARCVYVLGYGFDDNNSKRLDLFKSLRLQENMGLSKIVLFTNFGDINRINKKASKLFFGNFNTFLAPNPPIVGRPDGKFYCEKSVRDVYEALALDFDALEEH